MIGRPSSIWTSDEERPLKHSMAMQKRSKDYGLQRTCSDLAWLIQTWMPWILADYPLKREKITSSKKDALFVMSKDILRERVINALNLQNWIHLNLKQKKQRKLWMLQTCMHIWGQFIMTSLTMRNRDSINDWKKMVLLVLLPWRAQLLSASRPLLTVAHSDHNTPGTWSNPCTLLYSLLGCLTSVFRSPFSPNLPGSCLPTMTGLPPPHGAGGPQPLHFPPQHQHLPSMYPPLVVQSPSPILALFRTAMTSLITIWSLMTLGSWAMKIPWPSLLVEVGVPSGPAITEVLFGGY